MRLVLLATRAAAVGWLAAITAGVILALGPAATGWRPVVTLSGSMVPTIRAGDIAVVGPELIAKPGQIVLLDDPTMPSGALLHRIVEVRQDGSLITKGDANPRADDRAAPRSAIRGRVRYVVPQIGRLALLAHSPSSLDIGFGAVTLAALVTAAAMAWRSRATRN